ncbi:MAG TPA: copper resistance protein CopC [bacterium]|nr:copper resistance protein CopC [bacterium]
MRRSAVAVLVCGGVLAYAQVAGAHALLEGSVPAGGAALQRSPANVLLTFTEGPEPSLSTVHVLDSTGRQVDRGGAQPVPGHPLDLLIPLGPLPSGAYTVTWRTVSRVDGHVTGGSFAFGIGVSPGAALAATTSPFPSPLSILSRWGFYVGLTGLVGVAWVWTAAFAEPPAVRLAYPWLLWGVAATSVTGLGAAQAAAAGVGIGRLLATPLGAALWWRFLPIVGAGAALAVAGDARGRLRPPALAAAGVLAAGSMFADVLAGHAAAGSGPLRWPNIADQLVHITSVGVWLGGLAALLVGLGRGPTDATAAAARRFSLVAGITLGVTALTGVLRAVDEVGQWNALVTTDFGRLIVTKAALLLVLAALGGVNRYRSIPTVLATLRSLRRVGAAELTVAAVVLGLTGVLVGLAPPRLVQQAAQTATAITAEGSDFATSVRARLEITPGYPGVNRFVVRLVDYDTGRPVTAGRVTMRFRQPERPEVGPSVLALTSTAPGTYEAQGTNLSLDGTWSLGVLIERGLQSTEVPFGITARVRPEVVREIRAPGQPTLYSIDLEGGIVLDAYLDPGRPGFNEIHATFIAANSRELPVPRPIAIAIGPPGQPAKPIPVRRFGPGHFIGDAQLRPGTWHIEYSGTARDGTPLRAHLDVTL